MSWLFSQALVEEYLADICSDGEPSVRLNGNNTQQAYCALDKMTKFSRLSRFGMTYKPLTENRGEELLTLYLEDFHARTLALQEKEQESQESEVGCGEKWRALLGKYDRNTRSWRTVQCSLLEDLNESLETLPKWGMTVDGGLYPLQTLVQNTNENEFGLWLTPTVMDGLPPRNPKALERQYQKNRKGRTTHSTLREQVVYPPPKEMWPTPNAWDGRRGPRSEENLRTKNHQINLITAIKMKERETFPTPQASDNRDRGNMSNPSIQRRVAIGKQIMLSQSVNLTSGQLNPTWVEWLMGWPLGWTDLKPLEMDKSPCALQPHGKY
jgi:hypothetical protein